MATLAERIAALATRVGQEIKSIRGSVPRVVRFSGTTNASGIATIVFSPAFTSLPDVQPITGWNADQMVSGAITNLTLTGCSVTVKVSRGTLALSSGPFQTAGSGVSITVRAIGT
jgi:hypothetical protein